MEILIELLRNEYGGDRSPRLSATPCNLTNYFNFVRVCIRLRIDIRSRMPLHG